MLIKEFLDGWNRTTEGKGKCKPKLIITVHEILNLFPFRGVFRGVFRGAMGAQPPPPGPVKSMDFRGFSGPNGC